MNTKTESRLLKLLRPDDQLEQAVVPLKDLTLTAALTRLTELLAQAGSVAGELYLPQLAGHEHTPFATLLQAARLLTRRPKAQLDEFALRGIIKEGDNLPEPAYRCQLNTNQVVEIGHDSVSPLLTFEKAHPAFRELQWFLRCWDAIVKAIWAGKLLREIALGLNAQPILASSLIISPDNQTVPAPNWLAWSGPAWPMLEMREFDDQQLRELGEFCEKARFGSAGSHIRPVIQLHEWFKNRSVTEIEQMGLTNSEVRSLFYLSAWGRHQPNLDLELRFSVADQRFLLQFPFKAHDQYGYNNEQFTLPPVVLNGFLADANDQLKEDLVRILVTEYHYAAIRLTGDLIEPDLY